MKPQGICQRCGDLLGGGRDAAACSRCRVAPPPFRYARACFIYREHGGPDGSGDPPSGRDAILGWKYRLDHRLGAALARHLAEHSPFRRTRYDLVVPVPMHRSRLARRGFNQAAILARAVSGGTARFAPHVLQRLVATPTQSVLSRRARDANVQSVFSASPGVELRGRAVLLVDDVLTTGATAAACARALLDAGASLVDVLTLGRAISPPLGQKTRSG